MRPPGRHRRRLDAPSRAALAPPFVVVLLAPYRYRTRGAVPYLFRGALVLVAFFAAWTGAGAARRYWLAEG